MSTPQSEQDRWWSEAKHKKKQYRNYSLRAKGLPLSYASKSHEIWANLQDMLQSQTTATIRGIYVTEETKSDRAHKCYACVYVDNEEEGSRFITDMNTVLIDGSQITAEWSSHSKPRMPTVPHKLER